ncbi:MULTISPECIES: hypothetical protein [Deinococcus]|uniref:Type II toxin-antitoxin system HicB family antitoxin n=1 Tax=Deinococcus rufus TaxID=2136097 RepID=A0ABV7ZEJ6_9DEIO|nr:hypothetical protein [Deinococcus sp. AB2017081]WQE94028.1 hypothetical protein U2P90_11475 [Deinococcus sp. AB2017081]
MTRFQIQRDAQGLTFVAEVPDAQPGETFATRREADEQLLDSIRKQDMTPEAWVSLEYLRLN